MHDDSENQIHYSRGARRLFFSIDHSVGLRDSRPQRALEALPFRIGVLFS